MSHFDAFMNSHVNNIIDFQNYWNMGGKFQEYLKENFARINRRVVQDLKNTSQIPAINEIVEWIKDGKIELDYEGKKGLQAKSLFTCPEKFQLSMLDVLKGDKKYYRGMFYHACLNGYHNLRTEMINRNLVNLDFPLMIPLALRMFDDDFFYLALEHNTPSKFDVELAFQLQYRTAMEIFLLEGYVSHYNIDLIKYVCNDSPNEAFNFLEMCRNCNYEIDLDKEYDFEYGRMNLCDYAFLDGKWNVLRAMQRYGYETNSCVKNSYGFLERIMKEENTREQKDLRVDLYLIPRIRNIDDLKKYYLMSQQFRDILENFKQTDSIWANVIRESFGDVDDEKVFDFTPLAKAMIVLFPFDKFNISYDDNVRVNFKTIYASRFLNQTESFQLEILNIIKDPHLLRRMLNNANQKNYSFLAEGIKKLL